MKKTYSNYIFDFDETLCTIHVEWTLWSQKMRALLKKYDSQLSFIPGSLGPQQSSLIARFGKDFKRETDTISADIEKNTYTGYTRNDDCIRFAQRAAAHGKVFVWSSNMHATIEPILNEIGLSESVSRLVARDDVDNIKPDPDGFRLIYDPDISLSRYLFVGDSKADEGVALACGIDFLHVSEMGRE